MRWQQWRCLSASVSVVQPLGPATAGGFARTVSLASTVLAGGETASRPSTPLRVRISVLLEAYSSLRDAGCGPRSENHGISAPAFDFFFFAENRLVAMNIWASAHRADVAATLCPCGLYVHRLTDESIGPRSGAAAAAWSISLLVN
jgi:hypothetical protein